MTSYKTSVKLGAMSIVNLLILGALKRRQTAHGYLVYRDLTEWRVQTWTTIRPGSIYHALTAMENQHLIQESSNKNSQKLGPSKTEFKLTIQGELEFEILLKEVLKDINLIELSVGIAFMEYLTREEVIELLKHRVSAQCKIPNYLQALPSEDIPSTPAKHPELIRIWSDTYTDATISTEKLIKAIQSGKYIFKNEEINYEKNICKTS